MAPTGDRPEYVCRFNKIIRIKGLSYNQENSLTIELIFQPYELTFSTHIMIFNVTWGFGKASILDREWVL